MNRIAVLLAVLSAPVTLWAQSPDVAPFVELRPSWQVRSTKKSLFQWYDLSGHYSIVGFRMILENGLRVYVAQRFQRVDNTGDPDTLDEYYVENRGRWRLGKQYLPFGRREILRTTALAARLDTNLLLDQAPLTVAYTDAGSGRTRGVIGRIGGVVAVSVAFGHNFGIQATDLASFRNLEDAPGIGRGHRLLLGADTQFRFAGLQWTADWMSMRQGETPLDGDKDLSTVKMRFVIPDASYPGNLSWSRDWGERKDYISLDFELKGNDKISYIPMVRLEGLAFRDFALTAVVRF